MVCRGYRWAASLDLKQSRDLVATIAWGRLFHSGMVRGGGGMRYVCTVSCSRGCCSCVCCSFCGLICFLLAVVVIYLKQIRMHISWTYNKHAYRHIHGANIYRHVDTTSRKHCIIRISLK